MNVNEIKEGDCYIYTTDKNNTFGFIVLETEKVNKKVDLLKFIIVHFNQKKVSSVAEFKTGKIYTHNVYVGLKGDYKMGVQCYDFHSKDFAFLSKFKYIDNIKINKENFTIGGGTSFTNEMFFNLSLNIMDQANADYKKENMDCILN